MSHKVKVWANVLTTAPIGSILDLLREHSGDGEYGVEPIKEEVVVQQKQYRTSAPNYSQPRYLNRAKKNPLEWKTSICVIKHLQKGPSRIKDIEDALERDGFSRASSSAAMSTLSKFGKVRRREDGLYFLIGNEDVKPQVLAHDSSVGVNNT